MPLCASRPLFFGLFTMYLDPELQFRDHHHEHSSLDEWRGMGAHASLVSWLDWMKEGGDNNYDVLSIVNKLDIELPIHNWMQKSREAMCGEKGDGAVKVRHLG